MPKTVPGLESGIVDGAVFSSKDAVPIAGRRFHL